MNGERVIGVIPNCTTSVLGRKSYNLIVTNHRLIMAQLTSQMIKDEAAMISQQSKQSGEGRFKRMMSTMTSGQNLYQRYFNMNPQDAVMETPGNFFVDISQIKSAKVKSGGWDEDGKDPNELKLKWEGVKIVLRFSTISGSEAKNLLSRVLPNVK
jgi:hypothetical protein